MADYCINLSVEPRSQVVVSSPQLGVSVVNPTAYSTVLVGEQGPQGLTGPQGQQGPQGEAGAGVESLTQLSDVQITSPTQNDVLSYSQSINKWVNKPEESVLDGGNF